MDAMRGCWWMVLCLASRGGSALRPRVGRLARGPWPLAALPRWVDGPRDVAEAARIGALDLSERPGGNAVAVLYFRAANAIDADCGLREAQLAQFMTLPDHKQAVRDFEDLGRAFPKLQCLLAAVERDGAAFGAFDRITADKLPRVEVIYGQRTVSVFDSVAEAEAKLDVLGLRPPPTVAQPGPSPGELEALQERARAGPPPLDQQPGLRVVRTTNNFFPSPNPNDAPVFMEGMMKKQDEERDERRRAGSRKSLPKKAEPNVAPAAPPPGKAFPWPVLPGVGSLFGGRKGADDAAPPAASSKGDDDDDAFAALWKKKKR
ncbi:hypothetical protein M885DRAFT_561321 [Pelagophyceae sp. CCMP2097]|nr:hypothetical protein M885DRAFT_561321 [Pelagophyceae sp. CCMP2097]